MLVIDFTVSWLFEICSVVINGEIHVKSHQKSFVFLHMKSCNENLLELPIQYIYLLHVISICFTNKGASIEILFEMNTNILFDNRFYSNFVFLQTRNFLRYSLSFNVKMFYTFQIFWIKYKPGDTRW